MKKNKTMKKLLLLCCTFFALSIYGQMPEYKNIQVNEKVTIMDDTLDSCYVVIQAVGIPDLKNLIAVYNIKAYKNKQKFEEHPEWVIYPIELPITVQIQFGSEFTQGDLFWKISNELKTALLLVNPTWDADDLIIDE